MQTHELLSSRENMNRTSDSVFSRSLKKSLIFAAALFVFSQPAFGVTKTATFNCGNDKIGSLTVTMDNAPSIKNGPFKNPPNNPNFVWSSLGGVTITATATPIAPCTGANFAWMQAVTTDNPALFQDPAGNLLNGPYPDTPPGGYIAPDKFGNTGKFKQVFDNAPWYGNNQIGNGTLGDAPTSGPNSTTNFESWLVCVVKTGNPNMVKGKNTTPYSVIPLMGFDWGFTWSQKPNTVGNNANDWSGTAFLGALTQGGMPSNAFQTGYAKYYNMTYLANNEQNCKLCCVPEPSSIFILCFGVCGLMLLVVRRRISFAASR